MSSGSIEQLSVDEISDIFEKHDSDYVFVDVREPEEWEEGAIPGAVKIPLGELNDRLYELDKSKKYIMVCRSGKRSFKACSILIQNGFENVTNFDGGMLAWYDEDFPVEN